MYVGVRALYMPVCVYAIAHASVRLSVMSGEIIVVHVQFLEHGEAGQGSDDGAGPLLTESPGGAGAAPPPPPINR